MLRPLHGFRCHLSSVVWWAPVVTADTAGGLQSYARGERPPSARAKFLSQVPCPWSRVLCHRAFPVGSGGRPAGLGRGRAWTAPVLADSPCPASASARPRPEQGPSRGTRLPGAYGAGVRPEPPSSIFAEDERMLGEETAVNAGRGDAATRRGSLATPGARTHAEQKGPAP